MRPEKNRDGMTDRQTDQPADWRASRQSNLHNWLTERSEPLCPFEWFSNLTLFRSSHPLDEEEKSAPKIRHLIQRQLKQQQQQHPAKRKKDSILKVQDNAKIHTANRLPRHEGDYKSNVSFNRTIGIKYDDNDGESSWSSLRPSSSSSSSASL